MRKPKNKISAIVIHKVARETGLDRKTVRLIASGGMVKTQKYRDVAKYVETQPTSQKDEQLKQVYARRKVLTQR